jgi:hypothetical protein
VLDLLRRLKMHGFALTAELDRTSRRFISNRTVSQPLSEVKNFNPKDLWSKYEVMTQQDRIAVGLLKKIKRSAHINEDKIEKELFLMKMAKMVKRNASQKALKRLVKPQLPTDGQGTYEEELKMADDKN